MLAVPNDRAITMLVSPSLVDAARAHTGKRNDVIRGRWIVEDDERRNSIAIELIYDLEMERLIV